MIIYRSLSDVEVDYEKKEVRAKDWEDGYHQSSWQSWGFHLGYETCRGCSLGPQEFTRVFLTLLVSILLNDKLVPMAGIWERTAWEVVVLAVWPWVDAVACDACGRDRKLPGIKLHALSGGKNEINILDAFEDLRVHLDGLIR